MEMRRCAGSAKFGIEAHEALVKDFPKQASQKDGLGRTCRSHWNQYTTALRKAALERKAAGEEAVTANLEDAVAPEAETPVIAETTGADVTTTTADEGGKGTKGVRGRRRGADAKEVAQERATG